MKERERPSSYKPGWKEIRCDVCHGYGVVGVGPDQIADDCPECHGKGFYLLTPKGRAVRYPGGPFLG